MQGSWWVDNTLEKRYDFDCIGGVKSFYKDKQYCRNKIIK